MSNQTKENGAVTNREKLVRFLKEKGLYLVLIVCLALVGVAAFIALGGEQDGGAPDEQAHNVSSQNDESLASAIRTTPTPAPTPVPDFTEPPVSPEPEREQLMTPPVSGKVIWRFAADELVYSETLAQWMTHAAVDVAAKKGAEVYAVSEGTVERVFTDDALGVCVLIDHGELTALYANLKEEPPVKEGKKVSSRAVIGYVGDTAISECALQSHLHFAVYVEDVPKDPQKYFVFES